MTSPELERLVASGVLSREPESTGEVAGLRHYNAAHALALAGLRRSGYRSRNRQSVFQTLSLTLSVPAAVWRVLAKAHAARNRSEYEGGFDVDERLVEDVIGAATAVRDALRRRERQP